MNNQAAITLLKGLEQSLDDYCELNDEGKKAFGMAITALELFGNSEQLPSAQPETYKEKLNEIASALSEKFAYMNTCLNERDIILGYLGVKRSGETHCNTDCTNTKCESHPLSSPQPERTSVNLQVEKLSKHQSDFTDLDAQPEHNPDDERKIADLHKMVNYLFSRLERQWIPCNERLPEEGHDVLITKEPFKIKGYQQEVIKAKRSVDPRSGKIEWWSPEFGTLTNKAVLAWMPLPEPYREEGGE